MSKELELPESFATQTSRRDFIKLAGTGLLALPLAHLAGCARTATAADPLPSWNDTASKKAIVAFIQRTTTAGSPDFVPVPERIAVFDNDGALWAEQPMYVQMLFLIDRVKALAPQHPEWKTKEPFASLLKGDMKAVARQGRRACSK